MTNNKPKHVLRRRRGFRVNPLKHKNCPEFSINHRRKLRAACHRVVAATNRPADRRELVKLAEAFSAVQE